METSLPIIDLYIKFGKGNKRYKTIKVKYVIVDAQIILLTHDTCCQMIYTDKKLLYHSEPQGFKYRTTSKQITDGHRYLDK